MSANSTATLAVGVFASQIQVAIGASGPQGVAGPPGPVASTLDSSFAIKNLADQTKQLAFSLGGNTTAKTLTIACAQSTSQTLNIPNITASDTLATRGLANTFTAAQTIDLGSGVDSSTSPANVSFWLKSPDAVAGRLLARSWGAQALNFTGHSIGGTRAAPTATTAGFFQFSAFGYDGTIYSTSTAGSYACAPDGPWTPANHGIYHQWTGTAAGTTSPATWMALQSGNLGIGALPTVGNGLLQLASGTTNANGIAFGTDTFLYRSAANSIKADGGIGQYGVTPPGSAPTGYGTPTNPARTSSFDATTITLVDLAKEVAQLVIDLKATGVIAA